MRENTTQVSVNTLIPRNDVTDLELLLLQAYGFEYKRGSEVLYFFANDVKYDSSDPGLCRTAIALSDAKLAMSDAKNKAYFDDNNRISVDGYETVFQNIAKRSNSLPAIEIEGALACAKIEQGMLGGFATVITGDRVITRATDAILSQIYAEINAEQGLIVNKDIDINPDGGAFNISVASALIRVDPGTESVTVEIFSKERADDEPIDCASATYAEIHELDNEISSSLNQ